jgi:hypothetical protein
MAGQNVFNEILAGEDTFKFYTDGEWKTSTSGKTVNIINPSTLKPVFKVQGVFAFLEDILLSSETMKILSGNYVLSVLLSARY